MTQTMKNEHEISCSPTSQINLSLAVRSGSREIDPDLACLLVSEDMEEMENGRIIKRTSDIRNQQHPKHLQERMAKRVPVGNCLPETTWIDIKGKRGM